MFKSRLQVDQEDKRSVLETLEKKSSRGIQLRHCGVGSNRGQKTKPKIILKKFCPGFSFGGIKFQRFA